MGYVVSDQEVIENIMIYYYYINNFVDMVVFCVKVGCNLELFMNEVKFMYFYISE